MPVSEEPNPSVSMAFGQISRSRSRSDGASGAPPLESVYMLETSKGPCSSQASISGRAIASPTTVITETFSASTVRQISTGSKEPGVQHDLGAAEQPHHRDPLGGGVHERRQRVEHEVEVDDALEVLLG